MLKGKVRRLPQILKSSIFNGFHVVAGPAGGCISILSFTAVDMLARASRMLRHSLAPSLPLLMDARERIVEKKGKSWQK